jgi:hypothetical protein
MMKRVKAIRYGVTNALDDAYVDLAGAWATQTNRFSDVILDKNGEDRIVLYLGAPSPSATRVKWISGEIGLFIPDLDPNATIVTRNIISTSKIPITSVPLSAARAEVTVLPKKFQKGGDHGDRFGGAAHDNSISLRVKDPKEKIVRLEFLDKDGNIQALSSGSSDGDTRGYSFAKPLPPQVDLRIYLRTPKACTNIPFMIKDIPLPENQPPAAR